MTEPVDPKTAAIELTGYLKEVLQPPMEGASLGGILGAYIFKGVLRDAGYAIVPLTPTPETNCSLTSFFLRCILTHTLTHPEGADADEHRRTVPGILRHTLPQENPRSVTCRERISTRPSGCRLRPSRRTVAPFHSPFSASRLAALISNRMLSRRSASAAAPRIGIRRAAEHGELGGRCVSPRHGCVSA
jgi:hypothetical protein